MASRLKKLLRFHPYQSKSRRRQIPEISTPSCQQSPLDDLWGEQDSVLALVGVTPLRSKSERLCPISLPGDDDAAWDGSTPKAKGHGSLKMKTESVRRRREACCKWDMDRRARRLSTEDVLESTRISQMETAMLDQTSSPGHLPSVVRFTEQVAGGRASSTPRLMQDSYRGQLKLSVYMNPGLLTIHLVQGRHFCSKYKVTCDSFVQICLVPEDDQTMSCQTELVPDTNHPLYDEKFSFELLPEDAQKRVLISVWHRKSRSHNDLLGAMSFGVQKIINNNAAVSGWYYLLSEEIGRRKHFQVSSRRWDGEDRPQPAESPATPARVHTVGIAIHNIVLRRKRSGYGFTMTGGCPATVSRVTPGGAAAEAGLQTGDVIVRLNREKVHTASIEGLARIIKHCQSKILMEVQRPDQHLTSEGLPARPPAYRDLDSSCSSSDDDKGDSSLGTHWWPTADKENQAPRPRSDRHLTSEGLTARPPARPPAYRDLDSSCSSSDDDEEDSSLGTHWWPTADKENQAPRPRSNRLSALLGHRRKFKDFN